MKKLLLTGLVIAVVIAFTGVEGYSANTGDDTTKTDKASVNTKKSSSENALMTKEVKSAIEAYKKGDYLACISILKEYTLKNESNAIAWYYLGCSYMNIAMTNEASAAFDKVKALNSIDSSPKITSYAIQAQLCMQHPENCKYVNFTPAEVRKLKENPTKFISDYYAEKNKKIVKTDDVIQIESLINGTFPNNIHPQAQDFIMTERAKIKASQINSGKN